MNTTQNKPQRKFRSLYNRLEDIFFNIVLALPLKTYPQWLERHINKRTAEAKKEIVRLKWQKIELEEAYKKLKEKNGDSAEN
ncbi:MAG: hypothetical protein LUC97_06495 [Clostridiales bacterium]|nr:hypothetical protein [Clostridiales bacterium]